MGYSTKITVINRVKDHLHRLYLAPPETKKVSWSSSDPDAFAYAMRQAINAIPHHPEEYGVYNSLVDSWMFKVKKGRYVVAERKKSSLVLAQPIKEEITPYIEHESGVGVEEPEPEFVWVVVDDVSNLMEVVGAARKGLTEGERKGLELPRASLLPGERDRLHAWASKRGLAFADRGVQGLLIGPADAFEPGQAWSPEGS